MSCNITRGRDISCKDSIGGIKAIYIAEGFSNNVLSELAADAIATGQIDSSADLAADTWSANDAGVLNVAKYSLRPDQSSMTVAIQADYNAGTTMYEQTLSIALHKIEADDQLRIAELAKSRPQIFVEDSNGTVFLLGAEFGCDLSGGQIMTGAGRGDRAGLDLTFTARESYPVFNISSAAWEAATVSDAPTTVAVFNGVIS